MPYRFLKILVSPSGKRSGANMKSPFHMLFAKGLKIIFCDHKGRHDEWSYRFGTGVTELHCRKCGKVIKRIPLDDLPKRTLNKLVNLFKKDQDGHDED